ncbi:hypothetical protein BVRB_7g158500 [Beta vulgaris subsp. vulgaris]|nr:hypothetical protein BVRB_7g158500 [Beta vulgaris subsp. vulgaris]
MPHRHLAPLFPSLSSPALLSYHPLLAGVFFLSFLCSLPHFVCACCCRQTRVVTPPPTALSHRCSITTRRSSTRATMVK